MKLDLPTSFSNSDGMELVEAVRKKTGVSHRKSMIAINEVLEFLKNRVPMCGEMVDALLAAVQESAQQVHVCVMSITMCVHACTSVFHTGGGGYPPKQHAPQESNHYVSINIVVCDKTKLQA